MAQAPDIRVRLSAEGQQEVISAFRAVQNEANKLAKNAKGAFAGLGASLGPLQGQLRGLLGALGLTAGAAGLVALGRNALNTADQMGKMADRVGTTAETLSVLTFAATTADVSQQDLEASLIRLTKSIGDLGEGLSIPVRAFDQLGLAAKDFVGLDTGEAFLLVTERLAGMEKGIKRTEVAYNIFGTQGAKLLTLMDDLAKEGFDNVAERARRAGQIITTDLANAAAEVNNSLALMQRQVTFTAIAFLQGFGPELQTVLNNFTSDIQGGSEEVERFGSTVGRAFRNVVNVVQFVGGRIASIVGTTARTIGGLGAAIGALLSGEFSEAASIVTDVFGDWRKDVSSFLGDTGKEFDKLKERLGQPIDVKVRTPRATGGTEAQVRADVAKRVANLEKRLGDAQIKQLQDLQSQRQTILEQSAEAEARIQEQRASLLTDNTANRGAIAQAEQLAFQQRLNFAREAFNNEVALEQQKASLLKTLAEREISDEQTKQATITEINNRSSSAQLKSAQTLFSALIKLRDDLVKKEIATAQEIISLDKQVADEKKKLADFERSLQLEGLSDAGKIELLRREAVEQESKLRAAAIAGDLEGAAKLRDELQKTAQELVKLGATGTGKAAFEEASRLFTLAAAARKVQAQDTQRETKKAEDGVVQQIQTLKATIAELQSGLLLSVKIGPDRSSLQQMVTDIRNELTREVFQIKVQPTLAAAQGGPITQLASGGPVPGSSPTRTSDNILVAATAGEWMHPVRAVQYYGSGFMHMIDTLQLPRFAEGGQIGGGGAGDATNLNLTINGRRLGRVSGSRSTIRGLVTALKDLSVGTEGET